MKYSDLVRLLHVKYSNLSYKELKNITDEIFNFIKKTLKDGNRVEIRRFGMFEAKIYKAKNSFNPKTLQYNKIPARSVPFYKSSIVLKRYINKDIK